MNARVRVVIGVAGIALACSGCAVKDNDPDDSSSLGSGGASPGMLAPGAGSGGVAAPPATGSGGVTNVQPPAGSGGTGVVGAATGGAPAVVEGSGGAGPTGTGGATEVADGGMMPPPGREDLGKGDGSDVLTIGDSWMNILTNGGGIEGGLDRAGTSYRHQAIAGTTLINGDIPAQYDRATAGGTMFKTVIMTGGGNDVMFSGGCNTKEACEESVKAIVMALDELWTHMADDGVQDVFYIQYSKNVGTAPSDTRPTEPPDPPSICLSGRIVCHTVNTTDLIAATDSIDGIHPTSAGCDRIAARVLEMLETSGARR